MDDERGPIDKLLIDLFQSFGIGLIQSELLPQLVRQMGSFGSLHV
jgi:hypothetical protein